MTNAVVIGGSISGLLAARVLLNHYDQVTLLERDRLPDVPAGRPGIPQAQHVHALLLKGQQLLETLFPGLTDDLIAQGAMLLDWAADWRWLTAWGWMPQEPLNLKGLICSRLLLEWRLRDRLLKLPGFNLQSQTQATGLIANTDQTQVRGVIIQSHGDVATLEADFVVDASGRNSRLPDWLAELGYCRPQEATVNSFLGYASRWYRLPSNADCRGVYLTPKPGVTRRGGVLYPVEGNRCIITLIGVEKDYPPTHEAEFLAFAQSLRDPSLAEAIQVLEPISQIHGYRRTENRWRHYEKLRSMPEGVVTLGDAVCTFNPFYGQGMTAAGLGCLTLDECLRKPQSHSFALGFQKRLSRQLQTPWLMATGEDLRWDMTTGDRPGWFGQQIQQYFDRVMQSACHDPQIHRALLEVVHLSKPPAHLLRPRTFWRTLTLQL